MPLTFTNVGRIVRDGYEALSCLLNTLIEFIYDLICVKIETLFCGILIFMFSMSSEIKHCYLRVYSLSFWLLSPFSWNRLRSTNLILVLVSAVSI